MLLQLSQKNNIPLFGKKKNADAAAEKDGKTVAKKAPQVSKALPTDRDLSAVIIKPRVTEKAVKLGEKNVYTFVVRQDATKIDIRDAIIAHYNVTPVKIHTGTQSPNQVMSRSKGRRIAQTGLKKAYVYLQAGDSIEIA